MTLNVQDRFCLTKMCEMEGILDFRNGIKCTQELFVEG